jgi:hypothetical protein
VTVPDADDLPEPCPYCGTPLSAAVVVPEGETWVICRKCRGYCERDGEEFPMRERPAGSVEVLHDDALELLANMWDKFGDFVAFVKRESPEIVGKPGFADLEETIRVAREQAARPVSARHAELTRGFS